MAPPLLLTPEDPRGLTFVVLGNAHDPVIVQNSCHPHHFIYQALKQFSDAAPKWWPNILREYDCKVVRGRLNTDL